MNTKRIIISLFLSLSFLLHGVRAAAQAAVIDATAIASDIANTTSQLEQMVTMIDGIFGMDGKMSEAWGLESIEKIAAKFQEAGYLASLTESYSQLLKMTAEYTKEIKEWGDDGLSAYNRELMYIYQCRVMGERLYNEVISFFKNLKTTDADKKKEIDASRKQIDEALRNIQVQMTRAKALTLEGRRFSDFQEAASDATSTSSFVNSKVFQNIGTPQSNAKGIVKILRYLLGILFVCILFLAYLIFFRGAATGDNTSSGVYVRWFVGLIIAFVMLEIFSTFI